MQKITLREWAKTHKDARSAIDGQPKVTRNGGERGTVLVPVEIVKGEQIKRLEQVIAGLVAADVKEHMSIREDNADLNRASRALVYHYLAECGGRVFLGKINIYTEDREQRPIWEHKNGEKLYNFGASFVLPVDDQQLAKMIEEWNAADITKETRAELAARIDAIYERVEALGGSSLSWS